MQRSCKSNIARQQSSSLICNLILCNQKGQISLGRNTFLCRYVVILPKSKGECIKQTHTGTTVLKKAVLFLFTWSFVSINVLFVFVNRHTLLYTHCFPASVHFYHVCKRDRNYCLTLLLPSLAVYSQLVWSRFVLRDAEVFQIQGFNST